MILTTVFLVKSRPIGSDLNLCEPPPDELPGIFSRVSVFVTLTVGSLGALVGMALCHIPLYPIGGIICYVLIAEAPADGLPSFVGGIKSPTSGVSLPGVAVICLDTHMLRVVYQKSGICV